MRERTIEFVDGTTCSESVRMGAWKRTIRGWGKSGSENVNL